MKSKQVVFSVLGLSLSLVLLPSGVKSMEPDPGTQTYVIFRTPGLRVKTGKKVKKTFASTVRSEVKVGDEIRTKAGSRADVHIGNWALIRLKEKSVLQIKKVDFQKKKFLANLKLLSGKALVQVNKVAKKKTKFSLHTPVAVASVRGTLFVVEVMDTKSTQIEVLEGEVEMSQLKGEMPTGEPIEGIRFDVPSGKEMSIVQGEEMKPPLDMAPDDMQQERDWTKEPEYRAPADSPSDSSHEPPMPLEGARPEEAQPEHPERPRPDGPGPDMHGHEPDGIKSELHEEIRPDMREDIQSTIREELKPDLHNEFRSEIRDEIKMDVMDEISPEIITRDEIHDPLNRDFPPPPPPYDPILKDPPPTAP